jgi:hypothetical protein
MENVLILNIEETISYIAGRPEKMGQSYRAEIMLIKGSSDTTYSGFFPKTPQNLWNI